MENFLGKDGFNWWYGVVEDTNDPAKLGRCKVRIFGWHTDNLQELPTSALPWAQPLNPPNNSKSFAPPRLGDYVMGFFSDGMSGQAPVIMGVFPGLDAAPDPNKGFAPHSNLVPPQPPKGQVQYTVGQPTIAPLARGVVANTAISQSNDNLSHVCDITGSLRYAIASTSLVVKELIESIRQAIQALFEGVSSSPFADQVRGVVKSIKAKVDEIKKLISKAQDVQREIANYINELQRLIAYIATLPARIAALLKQCLNEATNGLSDAISNAKAIVESQSSGNLNQASKNETTAQTQANEAENATPGNSSGSIFQLA